MKRKSISELEASGSPNLARALARMPERPTAKRPELERLFMEILARRDEALLDVKKNGMVIIQEHFNRDKLYQKKVINPALKIVQVSERQLPALARLLTLAASDGKEGEDALSEEFSEIFEKYQKGSKHAPA